MLKQLYKRKITVYLSAALLGIFSMSLSGCAQETTDKQTSTDTEKAEKTAFLDRDMILGDVNAPIEIIEYASLTCNHCATFHNTVLPRIKEKYVDTGKVKIVFRSFMLNPIDMTASVITRCVPEKRYFAFMDALFKTQSTWYNVASYQGLVAEHGAEDANKMFVDNTMANVEKIARQVGLNKKKVLSCIANQDIGEYLYSVQQQGVQDYKVSSTPTIIINGNKVNNNYAAVERAIEDALD